MNDELLTCYERELGYLHQLGAEFAETHPKIAARLRIGPDEIEDPHVSRLVESVAFLNARIRHKLEDSFPELTDALLGVLYPHFLAPIPSLAIVQFACDRELTEGYEIPAGTRIQTHVAHGDAVRFRSAYPVTSWPIGIDEARLAGAPFQAPPTPDARSAAGVLHLSLRTATPQQSFAQLGPERLRFFLRGAPQVVHGLYELLFDATTTLVVASSPRDPAPAILPRENLRLVGFGEDEGLLPLPGRSFQGYRLLTEYFTFPWKFLFFEVVGLPARKLQELGERLDLFFHLSRSDANLEQSVSPDTFALGCTPVVNLFERRAEPIRLTQRETDYRVVPDARSPLSAEVYSIDRVTGTNPAGEARSFLPFYGLRHDLSADAGVPYWYAKREPAGHRAPAPDGGGELYLRLVDPGFRPSSPEDWILNVETTCTNRDLPAKLPFGVDQPRLQLSEGGGPIEAIRCLTAPTPALRPALRRGALWRFVSHLSLNHLSIAGGERGAEALREILRIHDLRDSPETRNVITGVTDVRSRPETVRTLSDGIPGVCRGTEVRIELDESRFAGSGLFLFATVLERFLGHVCSMNSFVQVVASSQTRGGEFHRWAPRAGEKVLL